MITIETKYNRGTVLMKVIAPTLEKQSAFGKIVQGAADSLKGGLDRWARAVVVSGELMALGATKEADAILKSCDEGKVPSPKDMEDIEKCLEEAKEGALTEEEKAQEAAAKKRDEAQKKAAEVNAAEAKKTQEANEAAKAAAKKEASVGDELNEQVEKTGGLQTTPAGVTPPGPTADPEGGVQVTGGDYDPATKQPQPGTPEHVTNPNEGQDPVDSNPAGGENAKSTTPATTAASKPAAGPKGKKGGGRVTKPKKS